MLYVTLQEYETGLSMLYFFSRYRVVVIVLVVWTLRAMDIWTMTSCLP